MDELELAQAEAEFVHAGLAQHRADRKRGSSLLVLRLQFKRRHRATRLLGFKPKAFQAQGPKTKTAKTTPTKKKEEQWPSTRLARRPPGDPPGQERAS